MKTAYRCSLCESHFDIDKLDAAIGHIFLCRCKHCRFYEPQPPPFSQPCVLGRWSTVTTRWHTLPEPPKECGAFCNLTGVIVEE